MMEDLLGPNAVANVVGELLRPPEKINQEMENRLLLLRSIPFAAILTTNFDYFLPGVPAAHQSCKRVMKEILRASPLSMQEQVVRQLVYASRMHDSDSDSDGDMARAPTRPA